MKSLTNSLKELKECLTAALAPYPVMPVGNVVCTKKKKKDDGKKEHNCKPIQKDGTNSK